MPRASGEKHTCYQQKCFIAASPQQRAWHACEVSEHRRWQDAEPLIRQAWDERE
jgi:hypothetical protein